MQHNKANAYLWTALSDMGVDVEEMPRNCRDSAHCGHCPHGCACEYYLPETRQSQIPYLISLVFYGQMDTSKMLLPPSWQMQPQLGRKYLQVFQILSSGCNFQLQG